VSGGDLSGHAPSTIIRVTDDGVEVIREGAVKIHAIRTDPKPGCPLCRANGTFKGEVLHQSGAAYLTRATTNPEYFLIVPEAHVESPADLPDEWWVEVKAMLTAMTDLPTDYNISINIGQEAGQSLGHLHFWLIGRQAGQPTSGKGFARLIDEANQS
jgi:diadenosine tetraphosphate (Ap4A) HIT family hydrolase